MPKSKYNNDGNFYNEDDDIILNNLEAFDKSKEDDYSIIDKDSIDLGKFNNNIYDEFQKSLDESNLITNISSSNQYILVHRIITSMFDNVEYKQFFEKDYDVQSDLLRNSKTLRQSIKSKVISQIKDTSKYKRKETFLKGLKLILENDYLADNYENAPVRFRNTPIFKSFLSDYKITGNYEFLKNHIRNVSNIENKLEIVEDNFDKLYDLAFSKLKFYGLIQAKCDSDEAQKYLNEKTDFETDASLQIDSRNKLSRKLKQSLIGIEDAKNYYYNSDKKQYQTIPYPYLFGNIPVSLNKVYDDISALFSYNRDNLEEKINLNNDSLFDDLIEQLKKHYDEKPYLFNVVKRLKEIDDSLQSELITNIKKTTINHINNLNFFKKKKDGVIRNSIVKNIDEINNTKRILESWESSIIHSELVTSYDSAKNLKVSKEGVAKIKYMAELAIKNLKAYKNKGLGSFTTIAQKKELENERYNLNKEIIDEFKNLFSLIGLDIGSDIIIHLNKVGYKSRTCIIKLERLLLIKESFLNFLLSEFKKAENNNKQINIQQDGIFKDKYVYNFIKYMSKFQNKTFALNYRDYTGRSFYGITLNKHFTDRFNALKTDYEFTSELLNNPFTQDSYILSDLINDDGFILSSSSFYNDFEYNTFSLFTVKKPDGYFVHRQMKHLSEIGFEKTGLNLFFNQGITRSSNIKTIEYFNSQFHISTRPAHFINPTFGDKDTTMTTKAYAFSTIDSKFTNGDSLVKLYINEVVLPEYKRILEHQKNDKYEGNIKDKEIANNLFFMSPFLNIDDSPDIYNENGFLKDVYSNENIKDLLEEKVYNYLLEKTKNKLVRWKQDRIANDEVMLHTDYRYEKSGNVSKKPFNVALDFIVSTKVNNANFFKFIAGDIANYFKCSDFKDVLEQNGVNIESGITNIITSINEISKTNPEALSEAIEQTMENVNKRLAGVVAPATDIIPYTKDETTNFLVLKEPEDYDKQSKKSFINKSTELDYINSLYGDYKEYDKIAASTDAMGFMNREEFLDVLEKAGHINYETKKEINRVDNKIDFSINDLYYIRYLLKPLLVNTLNIEYFNEFNDFNNIRDKKDRRVLYVKQSAIPLFKHFTKGTDLDVLREFMENNEVKNAVFTSAVKAGQPIKTLEIFDKNGVITSKQLQKDYVGIELITAPRQGHGILNDKPTEQKEIVDVNQNFKLIFSDISDIDGFELNSKKNGEELKEEYDKVNVELIDKKFKVLKNKLCLADDKNRLDLVKISNILKSKLENSGYPASILSSLDVTQDKNGNYIFKQPLWSNHLYNKIENILVSMINNTVTKHKTNVFEGVLASDAGMMFKQAVVEDEEVEKFISKNNTNIALDPEFAKRQSYVLRGQRVENGETKPTEIMISNKFTYTDTKGQKQLINTEDITYTDNKGQKFIDSESLPKQALEMFGFLIPSRSLNSTAFVRVIGILPDTYGRIIIANNDLIKQIGYKSNINRFALNIPNLKKLDHKRGKKVTKNSFDLFSDDSLQGLENKALNIKLAVHKNPNKEVQQLVEKPLDDNSLKREADWINESYCNNNTKDPISFDYFKEQFYTAITDKCVFDLFVKASSFFNHFQTNIDEKQLKLRKFDPAGKPYIYKLRIGSVDGDKILQAETLGNKDSLFPKSKSKSQILSNLIYLIVDNLNLRLLGKLNINNQTYEFIVAMVYYGYDEEFIYRFINQPIIRIYISLKNKVDDETTNYTKADMNKELAKYLGYDINNSKQENEKAYGFFNIKENNVSEGNFKEFPFLYYSNELKGNNSKIDTFKTVTKVKMKNLIENKDSLKNCNDKDFLSYQTMFLREFQTIQNQTAPIIKVIEDLDGIRNIGNDFSYMKIKKEQFIDQLLGGKIQNIEKNLGKIEFLSKDDDPEKYKQDGYYHLEKNIYFKPITNLGSMYLNFLFGAFEMFNELNIYKTSKFYKLEEKVKSVLKPSNNKFKTYRKFNSIKKIQIDFKRYFETYLFRIFYYKNLEVERKRLLIKQNDHIPFINILYNILSQNESLKKKYYILSTINIYLSKFNSFGNIRYTFYKDDINLIVISLLELFKDDTNYKDSAGNKYRGRDIALDLVRTEFIKDFTYNYNDIIPILPFELIDTLNSSCNFNKFSSKNTDSIEESNILTDEGLQTLSKEEILKNFTLQFFLNYPFREIYEKYYN